MIASQCFFIVVHDLATLVLLHMHQRGHCRWLATLARVASLGLSLHLSRLLLLLLLGLSCCYQGHRQESPG
jgi:hypothetical protein